MLACLHACKFQTLYIKLKIYETKLTQIRYVVNWLWSTWLYCRAGSAWGAGPGRAGDGLGGLLPHPSLRQLTLLPLRFRLSLAKLHETRDSPCEITRNKRFPLRNYTTHEISREITRHSRFPLRSYTKTRFPARNYTKHEKPIRDYSLPVSRNVVKILRSPAVLLIRNNTT